MFIFTWWKSTNPSFAYCKNMSAVSLARLQLYTVTFKEIDNILVHVCERIFQTLRIDTSPVENVM